MGAGRREQPQPPRSPRARRRTRRRTLGGAFVLLERRRRMGAPRQGRHRRGAAVAQAFVAIEREYSMVSSPRNRLLVERMCSNGRDGVAQARPRTDPHAPRQGVGRRTVVARSFQCAGWRSAEEYAQGEYGDEILGSATAGWSRRCRTGRGCSCTSSGRYRCPRHFLDGV